MFDVQICQAFNSHAGCSTQRKKFYHKDNITKELTSKSQKFGNYTLNDIICNETD